MIKHLLPLFLLIGLSYSQGGSYALDFDGSNDHVNISSVTNVSTQMSFFAWAKLTNSSDTYRYILNSGDWTSGGRVYTGFQTSSRYVVDVHGAVPLESLVALNYSLNMSDHLNAWHFYGFTIDTPSKTIVLYIDGVAVKSRTLTTFPTSLNLSAYIGDWHQGGTARGWIGNIDEVRIWNDVRTAAEIQEYMHKEVASDASGLVAYYKMSDGSGTSLADNSSNSNTGTLTNMETSGGSSDWVTSYAPIGDLNSSY